MAKEVMKYMDKNYKYKKIQLTELKKKCCGNVSKVVNPGKRNL